MKFGVFDHLDDAGVPLCERRAIAERISCSAGPAYATAEAALLF
jgi:hypothetical protein